MDKKKRKTMQLVIGGIVCTAVIALVAIAAMITINPVTAADETEPPDHSLFPQLQEPFESPLDVTAACLTCHPQAGEDLLHTTHWTWEYTTQSGQEMGKNNVINNYCIAVSSNEPRCSQCHIGYGYKNSEFDFSNAGNIDCLICHESTGTYKKFPKSAGFPVSETTEFGGKTWEPPDLNAVAQSVGDPSRANCGACHFTGGGAPGVKHGDLDPSMANPGFELDVHMDVDGLNFTCQTCHVTEQHQVAGSHYDYSVSEQLSNIQTCESCHQDAPHEDETLNTHAARVACQTCHIPEYAREFPTKMFWDWSTAGQKTEDGAEFQEKDENGWVIYDTKKGSFEWAMEVVPEYVWFDGSTTWYELNEEIDPEGVTNINTINGDMENPDARIWPVKPFNAIQGYDAVENVLLIPHLFGPDEYAYWKNWDWNKSFTAGMESVGEEFSGEYDWTNTVMYWPLTHQIAPAENALDCESCHSEDGRLDFAALGYPEEKANLLVNFPPVEPPTATPEPTEEPTEEPTATLEPTEEPEPTEAPPTESPDEDAEPTEAPEEETSSGIPTWVLIVGGLIIVAVAAYLLFRNRGEN